MHRNSAIVGFGLGLIMWVLEIAEVNIPGGVLIAVLIIAGSMVLYGGWPIIKRIRIVLKDSQQPSQSLKNEKSLWSIKNQALSGQGFEFFPSRSVLRQHHPLTKLIEGTPSVWVFWPAGTQATGVEDVIQTGNIKRLILPYPKESIVKELARLSGKTPEGIFSDIKRTARTVLDKRKEQDEREDILKQERIEARWYDGMVTNSIMLGKPEPLGKDSWLQVENLIPFKTEARSSYTLNYGATPFKGLFMKVKSDYEQLWHESTPIQGSDIHLLSKGIPIQYNPPWLKQNLEEDKASLSSHLHIKPPIQWFLDGLSETEPSMQAIICIINAACFPIVITGTKGSLSIQGIKCNYDVRMEGERRIPRGESGKTRLTQRVSQETVNKMRTLTRDRGGFGVDFSTCQLLVQPDIPDEKNEPVSISIGITEPNIRLPQKMLSRPTPPPLRELMRKIKARQALEQEGDLKKPNQPSSSDTEDSET